MPAEPSKKPRKEVALHNYDIYPLPNIESAKDCPESLQIIFKVVHSSKTLLEAHFGSRPYREDLRGVFDTNAAHDYNIQLKKRASDLTICCCDPFMIQSSEAEWMSDLSRLVFLQFRRKEEEQLDIKRPFHHWYSTVPFQSTKLMRSKSCMPA